MRSYSLGKLELLKLKWAVADNLWDYIFGSKFTLYNNPLAICQEEQVRASQIRWLSELALFEFDLKCRTGKSNKAADALSPHPYVPGEMDSDSDSEEYKTISSTTVCKE